METGWAETGSCNNSERTASTCEHANQMGMGEGGGGGAWKSLEKLVKVFMKKQRLVPHTANGLFLCP